MEKPISVRIKDIKNEMVSLINNSGLPLFIVEPIIKDILSAVEMKVEQQYQQDKATYENSLKQEDVEHE